VDGAWSEIVGVELEDESVMMMQRCWERELFVELVQLDQLDVSEIISHNMFHSSSRYPRSVKAPKIMHRALWTTAYS
jgi:hypothetical protein